MNFRYHETFNNFCIHLKHSKQIAPKPHKTNANTTTINYGKDFFFWYRENIHRHFFVERTKTDENHYHRIKYIGRKLLLFCQKRKINPMTCVKFYLFTVGIMQKTCVGQASVTNKATKNNRSLFQLNAKMTWTNVFIHMRKTNFPCRCKINADEKKNENHNDQKNSPRISFGARVCFSLLFLFSCKS